MMFHTSGLKTGSVRLDAVIFGLCCATDALVPNRASAEAAARMERLRRESVVMEFPLLCLVPGVDRRSRCCLDLCEAGAFAGYRLGKDQSAGIGSIEKIFRSITRASSARSSRQARPAPMFAHAQVAEPRAAR